MNQDINLWIGELRNKSSIYDYIINSWGFTPETIEKYRIGYIENGTINDTDMSQRIIIPNLNGKGEVIHAVGRAIGPELPKYKAIGNNNGITSRPLFNKAALSRAESVYLVEGEKDCITLLQAGFNATAWGGSNNESIKDILNLKKVKTIYIIPDREVSEVGSKKAQEIGQLIGHKKQVKILELPLLDGADKTDVNDFFNSDRASFKENIEELAARAWEYKHKGRVFEESDTGNAERLVYHYGDLIRYRKERKQWLAWNGIKWEYDENGLIVQDFTKEIARNIKHETEVPKKEDFKEKEAYEAAEKKHKKTLAFSIKSANRRARNDMIELAKSEPGVAISSMELDNNDFLINCKNGTLNLKTGELLPHRKADLLTKSIDIEYDPAARADRWEQFILEIMGHDMEMVEFLQRAIGYSFTGDTREQVMFIPYGCGSNGKSLFMDTIKSILGIDYSAQIQAESLAKSREGGEASPDIARLEGIRFVTSSESEEGRQLNEAFIKQVTGDKKITARFLHENTFEFEPKFKLWFATNHKPEVKGTDDGIWRRLILIPFLERFLGEEEYRELSGQAEHIHIKDIELEDKLLEEKQGILKWAIEGCQAWLKDGLGVPDKVIKATKEYRASEDILQTFLEEGYTKEPSLKILFADLFKEYNDYRYEAEEGPVKRKYFKEKLIEKGFAVNNGAGNKVTVFGLGAKDKVKPKKESNGKVIPLESNF